MVHKPLEILLVILLFSSLAAFTPARHYLTVHYSFSSPLIESASAAILP